MIEPPCSRESLCGGRRWRRCRRRGFLTRLQYVLHSHHRKRLTMAAQAAIVLAPPEMLDHQLCGGLLRHVADHSRAFQHRLTDLGRFVVALHQDNATELNPFTVLHVAKIDLYHVAFAHPILPRTIHKYRVHVSSTSCPKSNG